MREINKNICIVLHAVLNSVSPLVHDVRESKTVLDSGFHVLDSGFQLLDSRSFSGFLPFQLLVGFGISTAVFRIPQAKLFKIPDSRAKISRIPESLTWEDLFQMRRREYERAFATRALATRATSLLKYSRLQIFELNRDCSQSRLVKCFVIFLVFHFNSNRK